ncbi:serine-rich adhesin for platelets-like, partial [Musca vetustissima]|uniref:serine-rich adhesin for platelets-like n=1 Tax=Musca vetustissima TaxID=27455 RepID=UPI002AB5F773
MTSMEDSNSTTSGNLIGNTSSQDDYFRLYDASLDDDDDGIARGADEDSDIMASLGSLIVGIWNPANNQSNTTTTSPTDDADGDVAATAADSGLTTLISSNWSSTSASALLSAPATLSASSSTMALNNTPVTSNSSSLDYDSLQNSSSTSSSSTYATLFSSPANEYAVSNNTSDLSSAIDASVLYEANDTSLWNVLHSNIMAQISSSPTVLTVSDTVATTSVSGASETSPLSNTNNYNNNAAGDGDIALIDSAETLLAGETDYDIVSFNGGGGESNAAGGYELVDLINPYNETSSTTATSTTSVLHHIIGASSGRVKGVTKSSNNGVTNGNGGGNNILRTDTDNDGGSSFMLLLEDFGDYFYNYNGTMVSGTTLSSTSTSLTNIANNFSSYEYRPNCSNFLGGNLTNNISSLCYEGPTE